MRWKAAAETTVWTVTKHIEFQKLKVKEEKLNLKKSTIKEAMLLKVIKQYSPIA